MEIIYDGQCRNYTYQMYFIFIHMHNVTCATELNSSILLLSGNA